MLARSASASTRWTVLRSQSRRTSKIWSDSAAAGQIRTIRRASDSLQATVAVNAAVEQTSIHVFVSMWFFAFDCVARCTRAMCVAAVWLEHLVLAHVRDNVYMTHPGHEQAHIVSQGRGGVVIRDCWCAKRTGAQICGRSCSERCAQTMLLAISHRARGCEFGLSPRLARHCRACAS